MLKVMFRWGVPAVLFTSALGCCFGSRQQEAAVSVPPTATMRPTFTPVPPTATATSTPLPAHTPTVTRVPPTDTATAVPTGTSTPTADTPVPPTPVLTYTPEPVATYTAAPTPDATASRLRYVIAGSERKLDCFEVAVYGTVLNANNSPLEGVTVEAVGIHGTQGRHLGTVGEDGKYAIPLARFSELPHSEWYVAIFEGDEEVSERFHWTATAACQSSDSGDSQVLRVHWKLIE